MLSTSCKLDTAKPQKSFLDIHCMLLLLSDNESENAFRKKIDIGCTIAVAIFILSSLRNCVIYGIRNHEYRTISRALWKSIKSRCSTIVQENYRFDLTSRMKTATKVASSNLSQTVVRKK